MLFSYNTLRRPRTNSWIFSLFFMDAHQCILQQDVPLLLIGPSVFLFRLLCFHFHFFLCIFWFLFWFLIFFFISDFLFMICWLFRSVLFSLHMFEFLIVFFLQLRSSLTALWSEKMCFFLKHFNKGNFKYIHKKTEQYNNVKWKLLSHVWLFVTNLEFSRPEYWNG